MKIKLMVALNASLVSVYEWGIDSIYFNVYTIYSLYT